MPWLKVSDQAAFHPVLLRILELHSSDDRSMNEVFGFVTRLAVSAAAYETDYVVSLGVIKQVAGMSRWKELVEAALACGFLVRMQDAEGGEVYQLVEEDDLFHMILREERAWKNQRDRDLRNEALTMPVRKRDGDECRWCGKIVNWRDRKSGKGGTYDHLHPGKDKTTVDDLIVSCKACNSSRKDAVNQGWAGRKPLPAPTTPYYGAETVKALASSGITVEPASALPLEIPGARPTVSLIPVESPARVDTEPLHEVPGSPQVDDSRSHPTPQRSATPTHAADGTGPTPRPPKPGTSGTGNRPSMPAAVESPSESNGFRQIPADTEYRGSGYAGSGRGGSGQAGKGRGENPRPREPSSSERTPPHEPRRKRNRRRRRKN